MKLNEFLKEHFTVRVKDGKVVDKPKTPKYFDPQEEMCPDLEDACYTYHYATEAIKLPTLAEFCQQSFQLIKEMDSNEPWEHSMRIRRYISLLETPLTLSQFIPCVDGVPVEEPIGYHRYKQYDHDLNVVMEKDYGWSELCKQYQAAQNAVIFEGWEVYRKSETHIGIKDCNDESIVFHLDDDRITITDDSKKVQMSLIKTISDLLPFGVMMKIK